MKLFAPWAEGRKSSWPRDDFTQLPPGPSHLFCAGTGLSGFRWRSELVAGRGWHGRVARPGTPNPSAFSACSRPAGIGGVSRAREEAAVGLGRWQESARSRGGSAAHLSGGAGLSQTKGRPGSGIPRRAPPYPPRELDLSPQLELARLAVGLPPRLPSTR